VPKGTVVVVRSAPNALLIWDASAAVGDLMIARRTGDDGMRELERDGIAIMAARALASISWISCFCSSVICFAIVVSWVCYV